jgi:hypothetical protein
MKSIRMENFEDKDYQFRGPLANTGYKIYNDYSNNQKALLVESSLSQQIVGVERNQS